MNADINLLTRTISSGADGKYSRSGDSTQVGQFIGIVFLSVRSVPLALS